MSDKVIVRATVNGEPAQFLCEPRQSLLEVLRDELKLTGTKEGCNNGNCGACNVIFNGMLVNSCIVLAVEADGGTVETIEGVCTPGFIVSAKALLDHKPKATEAEIRHWCAGNLCRCTGYDKIVRAVLDAETRLEAK